MQGLQTRSKKFEDREAAQLNNDNRTNLTDYVEVPSTAYLPLNICAPFHLPAQISCCCACCCGRRSAQKHLSKTIEPVQSGLDLKLLAQCRFNLM